MKKILRNALVTSVIMVAILAAAVFILKKGMNEKKEVSGLDLLTDAVDEQIINKGASEHLSIGKNGKIMKFSSAKSRDVYNESKSASIKKKIDRMKKHNKYTVDNPLMIWNPFGTNKLSLYYYFRDKESTYLKYTIQVDNDQIPDYTRVLNNHTEDNLTRFHEYSLTGFVPGYQNYVTIRRYNKMGKLIKKQYFDFYVDKLSDDVKTMITYEDGKSTKAISEGLYCICGYQNGKSSSIIPFYDNSGVIRCAMPIVNYRTDRIENVDGSMIYSFSSQAFAKISDIGQVEKVYELGKYSLHHDFIYNGYGQLWCLASKNGRDSIRDYIISVNVKNGNVEEMADLGKMFSDVKQRAAKRNRKGKLNWIDLNSISRAGSSDVIVSSRELSSIIKINHITSGKPKVAYIISDRSIWKNKNNKKYLLLKGAYLKKKWYNLSGDKNKLEDGIHNFSSQLGQNGITCEQGKGLSEGQYYLTMLNNNYAYSTTLPNVNWAKFIGAGKRHKPASNSYYYEYLVDEKAGYYGLKHSYRLPYTANGGNVFWNGTNTITNSMEEKVFGEYDYAGKLIREYNLKAYRVYKYDMKNIWYY